MVPEIIGFDFRDLWIIIRGAGDAHQKVCLPFVCCKKDGKRAGKEDTTGYGFPGLLNSFLILAIVQAGKLFIG
jgi:hypothetical protein